MPSSFICTLLFFFFFFCFLSSCNSLRVLLTGDDWTITDNRSYVVQGHVPGTIHTILFAAKVIPEPYAAYNDLALRSLVHSSWTFTKTFSLTQEFLALAQITLHLEQVDTVANVTLNECYLGQTTSMFVPYAFEVTASCLRSENQLQLNFTSPVIYANEQASLYNDTVMPECPPDVQHGECHVQFIRKEPCSFSWDWVRLRRASEDRQRMRVFFRDLPSHPSVSRAKSISKELAELIDAFNWTV